MQAHPSWFSGRKLVELLNYVVRRGGLGEGQQRAVDLPRRATRRKVACGVVLAPEPSPATVVDCSVLHGVYYQDVKLVAAKGIRVASVS